MINAEAEEGANMLANTLLPLLQFPVEVVAVAVVLIAVVVKHDVAGAGGDRPIGFSGKSVTTRKQSINYDHQNIKSRMQESGAVMNKA